MGSDDQEHVSAIARSFDDPAAVWTIDEIAARFGLTLGEAIRALSELEAIGVVRRIDDEYVPGSTAATAS